MSAHYGWRLPSASLVNLVEGQGIGIYERFAHDVPAAEEQLAIRFRELVLVVPHLMIYTRRNVAVRDISPAVFGVAIHWRKERDFAAQHDLGPVLSAQIDVRIGPVLLSIGEAGAAIGLFRYLKILNQWLVLGWLARCLREKGLEYYNSRVCCLRDVIEEKDRKREEMTFFRPACFQAAMTLFSARLPNTPEELWATVNESSRREEVVLITYYENKERRCWKDLLS